jgi:trehalose synthase
MGHVGKVVLSSVSFDRFRSLLGDKAVGQLKDLATSTAHRLHGRVFWNIHTTSAGGGGAEMLRSLLPYARGLGIDARWVVVGANPRFFNITKRLHHALHGACGDGSPLSEPERRTYEQTLAANLPELLALVHRDDIVLVHDPQSAGLVPALIQHGAKVLWRCHVGTDTFNEQTDLGWDFIARYLRGAVATVFSRKTYVPKYLDADRARVIAPSIDPFSAKNQDLDDATVRSIIAAAGLVGASRPGDAPAAFIRDDGSTGHIERRADVVREGPAPGWDTPLVVQVSRWDPLKDPVGVLRGFVSLLHGPDPVDAHLMLIGPDVTSVTDDPEGRVVLDNVICVWKSLPADDRRRIHLASLPAVDREENAAIVNAIQRHATVIVQKSLQEGFGLTVTEAMWKARPIVASAVGGIQEQIVDGSQGLLIADPTDLPAYANALRRLLRDPELATRLGKQAKERARSLFLSGRHLIQYAQLLEHIDIAKP